MDTWEEMMLQMGLNAIQMVLTKFPAIAAKFKTQLNDVTDALVADGYGTKTK